MKKLFTFILCAVISFATLAVAGCKGCGPFEQRELCIYCYFHGDSFELPVKFKGSHIMDGYMQFASEKDLTEFKQIIDDYDYKDFTVKSVLSGNLLVVEKTNSDGKVHYYSLILENSAEKNIFGFTFPGIALERVGCVLFPLHFIERSVIEDINWSSKLPELKLDIAYPTAHSIDEFVKFYSSTEECEVTQTDNVVEVIMKRFNSSTKLIITFNNGNIKFSYDYKPE